MSIPSKEWLNHHSISNSQFYKPASTLREKKYFEETQEFEFQREGQQWSHTQLWEND